MKKGLELFDYQNNLSVPSISEEGLVWQTEDTFYFHFTNLTPNSTTAIELGKARERAFEASGKGSGKELDLDSYDATYSQIIARCRATNEIVGGLRYLRGDSTLGPGDFYRSEIFQLEPRRRRLERAIEVGRVFVAGKVEENGYYRGAKGLYRGLWKALKAAQEGRGALAYLTGALTISRAYSDSEKVEIASYYLRKYPAKCVEEKACALVSPGFSFLPGKPEIDRSILRPELFRISQIHYPVEDLAYEAVAVNAELGGCWEVYFECSLSNPNNYWGRL